MSLPASYAQPRMTTSQHATPTDQGSVLGWNRHLTVGGFVRSIAYAMFGNVVTRYIVLPTTIGAPSCPRSSPVENDHASFSCFAFEVVICARALYRANAESCPC